MVELSKRDEIIQVINKLFIYTDYKAWDKLKNDVFTPVVKFDMSSAGGGPEKEVSSSEICNIWEQGFTGIDAIHHQAGNHLVTMNDPNTAVVFCYAVAAHFKKSALKGNVREFVGSYDIELVLTNEGWRINSFRYNLKYINGNASLE